MDIRAAWQHIERLREQLDDEFERHARECLALAFDNVVLSGSEWSVYIGHADGFAACIRDDLRNKTMKDGMKCFC